MIDQKWVHKDSGLEVAELGGFEVLYTDNPWQYGDKLVRGGAEHHYGTMSLAELCLLPVERLAAENSVIFMWATWPTLLDAFAVMKAWGFSYKNCGLTWVKTNKVATDTPFVGLGHWTRGNTEPCLLGVRGKPERVGRDVQQVILDLQSGDGLVVAPIGEHSAKPAEARDRILRLMGDVPAVELFARAPAPGWESWGNQVESTISLEHR